jgi:predicted CXXCH cytochrome family protein
MESAKQKALRMPLDYYRQATALDRAKVGLTLAASLVAAGYVAWACLGGGSSVRQFSPGPLAAAHSAWEDRCSACHVDFAPLREDAAGTALVARLMSEPGPYVRAAGQARCRACHRGPAHHGNQIAGEVRSCAGCHRDHQGQSADLTQVTDALCTECHRDIAGHRSGPSMLPTQPIANVADWASHPPFRSIGGEKQAEFRDPGRLKFNHQLHMLPGQYAADSRPSGQLKLADIDPRHWQALGYAPSTPRDTVVELNCNYCHELEPAGRAPQAGSGDMFPSLGAYMLPVRYDRHCAACHERDLRVETVGIQSTVPHGLRAGPLRELLAKLATERRVPLPPPAQPIPGKTPGNNLAQMVREGSSHVAEGEAQLRSQARCGKCHEFAEQPAGSGRYEVLGPDIPTIWLKHARFSHAAHRAVKCSECHAASVPPPGVAPRPNLDGPSPMIPNIDNCRKCHGSAAAGAPGVRSDCALCHRYHGGDWPPHGVGAEMRGLAPKDKRTISEFLLGK